MNTRWPIIERDQNLSELRWRFQIRTEVNPKCMLCVLTALKVMWKRKWFQSCLSVSLFTRGSPYDHYPWCYWSASGHMWIPRTCSNLFTWDLLHQPCPHTNMEDLPLTLAATPNPRREPQPSTCMGTTSPLWTCSNMFAMWPIHLSASGQLTFDWKAFLSWWSRSVLVFFPLLFKF